MKDVIGFYEREFYIFSNFSAFKVDWNGEDWMTAEHAYQASKFLDKEIVKEIKEARSAHDSKKIAEKYSDKKRKDWSEVKLSIMEEIVRTKANQHQYIQKKLIETGDIELVEDSHKDSFWGWGPDKNGENNLGKIWMKIREELKRKN